LASATAGSSSTPIARIHRRVGVSGRARGSAVSRRAGLGGSERIGVWGGSYGGYLTALALARNSNLFAAGVDLHGVHDWGADVKELYVKPSWRYEKGDVDSAVAVAYRSSPIASMKTWRSPVLLIQGDDDHNVHFAETVNLARRLELGDSVRGAGVPDELHGFLLHSSWLSPTRRRLPSCEGASPGGSSN
jgi:dipeptidyl aminopeptidase/acylaminoacyl peptidase